QKSDEIVDVTGWSAKGIAYNVGAREKSLLVCPADCDFSFCHKNHKYLFKETMKQTKDPSKDKYPDQYWAEIMAFHIGILMGIDVPPAFVAINSKTGNPGALIEWFTNDNELSVSGGDYMKSRITDFDEKRGAQHNLLTILAISKTWSDKGILSHDWQEYWGLCLCFDALIGNTDRHQENWQAIWKGSESVRFSPLFDNGTSLGHEIFPNKFDQIRNKPWREGYLRRGKHHMKWSLNSEQRLNFIDGVIKYCEKFSNITQLLLERLSWDESLLWEQLKYLTRFKIKSSLTIKRAEFVFKLTCARKLLLTERLEKLSKQQKSMMK
ncbi:MAG: HipA domain-containing protein, partial [Endozoicomonadaceae bacterium]|nr:HipA domain-containing protein [Endozoicomonadaceae bacterium]